MIEKRPPNFASEIIFYSSAAFTNKKSLMDDTVGVILSTDEGKFQAVLDLRLVKPVYANEVYTVDVFLVDHEFAGQFFKKGTKFKITKLVVIGDGVVTACYEDEVK